MVNFNESSNKPILYELLEYFVRKQEPELIVSLHSHIQERKEKHSCKTYILNLYTFVKYNINILNLYFKFIYIYKVIIISEM